MQFHPMRISWQLPGKSNWFSDRDFGELIFQQGLAHAGVIFFRLPGAPLQTKIEQLKGARFGPHPHWIAEPASLLELSSVSPHIHSPMISHYPGKVTTLYFAESDPTLPARLLLKKRKGINQPENEASIFPSPKTPPSINFNNSLSTSENHRFLRARPYSAKREWNGGESS